MAPEPGRQSQTFVVGVNNWFGWILKLSLCYVVVSFEDLKHIDVTHGLEDILFYLLKLKQKRM